MPQPVIPHIPGYKSLRRSDVQGGMGFLYHGRDEKTDKEVMIKLMNLSPDSQNYANYLRRFTRETDVAKLLERALKHDHVLGAIHHGDIPIPGSHNTIPYLVYPYIKDGSLSNLLKQKLWRTLSLLEIANIILQAAKGLDHLHQKLEMVHQDVKPSNFLYEPTQHPPCRVHIWLIDFGAAEWEGETQSPIGTEGYIAPEQILGHIRYSADQYALAVMARLLLTGSHPPQKNYQAPDLSTPLTQLNPQSLHEQEIDRVVLKALAQRPEDRFSNILEFAQALQKAIQRQERPAFYADRTESLQPPSVQKHAEPSSFYQAPTERASSMHPSVQRVTKPASSPVPQVPIVIPPGTSFVPHQPLNETLSLTPHVAMPKSVPSLPSFPLQKLFTVQLPDSPTMLAWSSDDTALVCTFREDAPILIYNDNSVEMLSHFEHGHCACWSPNGQFLAISTYNNDKAEIRFWDRAAPKEHYQPLHPRNGTPIYGLDWSSTGLLAIWLESGLFAYDLSMLSAHTQLPPPSPVSPLGNSIRSEKRTTLRWSPDGTWLAAGATNGKVICYRPSTSTLCEQQPFSESVDSISWSPDSTTLVAAFRNKRIMFWDLGTGSIAWEHLPERPTMVSISPRTAQLAVATKQMLFFGSIGDAVPTASHPGQQCVAWSPTNKLAMVDKEMLVIWRA